MLDMLQQHGGRAAMTLMLTPNTGLGVYCGSKNGLPKQCYLVHNQSLLNS